MMTSATTASTSSRGGGGSSGGGDGGRTDGGGGVSCDVHTSVEVGSLGVVGLWGGPGAGGAGVESGQMCNSRGESSFSARASLSSAGEVDTSAGAGGFGFPRRPMSRAKTASLANGRSGMLRRRAEWGLTGPTPTNNAGGAAAANVIAAHTTAHARGRTDGNAATQLGFGTVSMHLPQGGTLESLNAAAAMSSPPRPNTSPSPAGSPNTFIGGGGGRGTVGTRSPTARLIRRQQGAAAAGGAEGVSAGGHSSPTLLRPGYGSGDGAAAAGGGGGGSAAPPPQWHTDVASTALAPSRRW